MPINPLYNRNNGPSNSTQPTKAVNKQVPHISRTHNTFDMSYHNFKTQKFGQYEPFFVMEAVESDMLPIKSNHSVRSLPFASSFLSEIKMNKDFFMVPYNAMYPNTWEYIYKHPSSGDDVPADVHPILPYEYFAIPLSWLTDFWRSEKRNSPDCVSFLIQLLVVLEKLYSTGSLLNNLGYKINCQIFSGGSAISFDEYFDKAISKLYSVLDPHDVLLIDYTSDDTARFTIGEIDIYQFISLYRRYGFSVHLNTSFTFGDDSLFEDIEVDDYDFYGVPGSYIFDYDNPGNNEPLGINISRLLAYQLACFQYFVNPQIDAIYNAQLYRDNFFSIISPYVGSRYSFSYNGISVLYDFFSFKYFSDLLYRSSDNDEFFYVYCNVINYLFSFNETLRFGDYYTDSRTQPLAIGDDTVSVSADNTVSVIDINKSLIYQRFRNAVVKMKNTYDNYLNSLFGTEPSPDYHIPKHIVHYEDTVKSFEVANTSSDNTGSLVTNLSSSDSSKIFEISVDMSCIVIGISYFTIPRIYCQTKDKHFFHVDRFDMFNPMLQYIGDQPVDSFELSERLVSSVFAYNTRNSEYKQRYSVASGGFITKLPSWAFITDFVSGPLKEFMVSDHLSPAYIRSYDYEFNRFFKQLSGYSYANSFHFIVVYNNECVCNRPMEVSPNTI